MNVLRGRSGLWFPTEDDKAAEVTQDNTVTEKETVIQKAVTRTTTAPEPEKPAPKTEPVRDTLQPSDEFTARARRLTSGKWVEFSGTDGKRQRAKLSWISPITNTYLFTDRKGLKVGNYSLDEFALLLRCARARVLDTAPLMDRAVSTVLKEYQKH